MIEHIKPYLTWRESLATARYLRSGRYLTESVYTEELEHQLANFLGVKYVSMVPSGTSALYLSLLASGVGPGDKVIVPDLTMIATVNAVRMTGATPVLVDVEEFDYCLDVSKANTLKKAKALIHVELNGQAGDLYDIKQFCKKNNVIFIEDSCQAFGSKYGDKYLGSFSRFAAFSLGFHKIITTGQGGFVVSHTKKDYETVEKLKDFGRLEGGNDIHDTLGFNFKFTDVQAVIGLEQMKSIEWRIEKKRQIFEWYWDYKLETGYVPWFIELMTDRRDEVYNALKDKGIATRKMYPPVHTQKMYRKNSKQYPIATRVSRRGLWLPSSLSLRKRDVKFIRRIVDEALQGH